MISICIDSAWLPAQPCSGADRFAISCGTLACVSHVGKSRVQPVDSRSRIIGKVGRKGTELIAFTTTLALPIMRAQSTGA